MTETMAAWSAPECPFKIEYTPHVLEDIRLAVMDAFFSLPRGGAEIGGILLRPQDGRDGGRLTRSGEERREDKDERRNQSGEPF